MVMGLRPCLWGHELKSACGTTSCDRERSRQSEVSVSKVGGFPKDVHIQIPDRALSSIQAMTCEFISKPLSLVDSPLARVKLDVRGSGVPESEKWPCCVH